MKDGGRASWALWVLTGEGTDDLMTVADGDREALLVFGFEEEAGMFLRLVGGEGKWGVRRTTVAELAPLLRGPYRDVGRVALDPVPVGVNSSGPLNVAWKSTREFLGSFGAGA